MTNPLNKFISLALFAHLLIALTLQHKTNRGGHKSTFLSNNKEFYDNSNHDSGLIHEHDTKPYSSKLNDLKKGKRTDPDEEVEDIPYTWAPGVFWHEDICHENFDLVIVMQATNDPLEENEEEDWMTTYKPFLIRLVNSFNISEDKVRAGLVLFGSNPSEIVSFKHKRSQSKQHILDRIEEITEADIENAKSGNYVDALQYTIDNMLFSQGTRGDAAKVVVSFVSGPDNDRNEEYILHTVDDYKRKVIKLISVGMHVGDDDNEFIYLLGRCKHYDRRCPTAIVLYHDDLLNGPYGVQRRLCDDGLGYYETGKGKSKVTHFIE